MMLNSMAVRNIDKVGDKVKRQSGKVLILGQALTSGLVSLCSTALLFVSAVGAFAAPAPAILRPIGVARVDVTPAEPIRLTGYVSRKTNSAGVERKLWAKALAIGADGAGPAVLITLDNCGIAEDTYKELVQRLEKKTRL